LNVYSDSESESYSGSDSGSESESESFSDKKQIELDESYELDDYGNSEEQPIYKKLQLIIHTNGGSSATSDMISNILLKYPGQVECFIPYYSFSAGSFIALSCNKIFMERFAMMGPTDPQLSYQLDSDNNEMFSSKVYLNIFNEKDINKISDNMLLKIYDAKINHDDNIKSLGEILTKQEYPNHVIERIINEFGSGDIPHFKPFNSDQLRELGLNIDNGFPKYMYDLFKSYLREIKKYRKN